MLSLVFALLVSRAAHGVLVLTKTSEQGLTGFLVSQSAQQIVLREVLPDGSRRETTIPRSEIEEIIQTVSPERLAELTPSQPQLYREYAEELAAKRRDPEAREMAIRLFQIAATLDPPNLGRGSLLGMIALARSPAEEARFRAAAYLVDPRHDANVLRATGGSVGNSANSAGSRKRALADLLRALQFARRGQGEQALQLAERPAVKEQLQAFATELPLADFYAACSSSPIDDARLKNLLGLELSLTAMLADDAAETAHPRRGLALSWREAIATGQLESVRPVAFDTLTEFDPAACLFRGGKWISPGEGADERGA
jgi:hypothetical protein